MNALANPLKRGNTVTIKPAKRLRGHLHLPGDKSISHRAAIISALAHRGVARIENFSTSQDCRATLACLRQLGVLIEQEDTTTIRIEGVGPQGFSRAPAGLLDCGNSGSTMRMLAGALAGQNIIATLTGDESLRSRPMKRVIEPLEQMGANITSNLNRAPLRISGRRPFRSITFEMSVPSAQVKSAILLASLNAHGRTEVIEGFPATRDHTERMLNWFGVQVATKVIPHETVFMNHTILEGPQRFAARDILVPGDISSAAFFIVAATLLPGSELEITNVGLNPTRAHFLRTLQRLGAQVRTDNVRVECNELVGDIQVRGVKDLAPIEAGANVLRGPEIAQLIDELTILAVCGTQIEGGLEIRDARELRVKESDRIVATVANLRAMGATVQEHEDGLTVAGPVKLKDALLDAHGDHRIAMAFTIASLIAHGESEIVGAECTAVSFPEFYELLESVVER